MCEKLEDRIIQAWKETTKKISDDIKKTFLKDKEKAKSKETTNLDNHIAKFIEDFENKTIKSSQELFNFTIGLMEQKTINSLGELINKLQPKSRSNTTKTKNILTAASRKFQNKF